MAIRKKGVIARSDDLPISFDFAELVNITKQAVSNPVITQERSEGNVDLVITAPAIGGADPANQVSASATCPSNSVGGRWTITCRVASGDHAKSTSMFIVQDQTGQ